MPGLALYGLDGVHSYSEASSLRPLLGESLCPNRPFLVSLLEGVVCFGFSPACSDWWN